MRYLIALVMALSFAIGSASAEDPKFKFKMTSFVPEGTVSWKLYPEAFAAKMKLATDGAVEVKPYGAFVLASIFEAHRAVLDGRADMAYTYPAFEINELPASAFISDVPGGMGPDAKLLWVLAGGGEQLWTEYRHSLGLHGLFCGVIGSELFANSHKKVQSLADFKGYRYRTAGANTTVMQALGAAPTTVPGPEVFTMLERKGVDGAEYLDPYGNFSLGFHKIAKYVIYPGIHAPGGLYEVLMRKETWDSLPADIQEKMKLVCDSVLIRAYATLNYNNATAMKEMGENANNELVRLDADVIAAFRKAGRDWVDQKIKEENAKGNPWMEKFAKSFYDFQEMWTKNSGFLVTDFE
jgi:TRAP-type mannitol/chloroaromatic compound transport system substrate-binding protein